MSQTPARDFIKDAVVDFRFYTGSAQNFANTTNALSFSSPLSLKKNHGLWSLDYSNSASQTWMTTGQTEMTFEALVSMDLWTPPDTTTDFTETTSILSGDWNIGFYTEDGSVSGFDHGLWASFNGNHSDPDLYIIKSPFVTNSAVSTLRGSLLHVVVSSKYTSGTTTLEVTTLVNGVYDTATSTNSNYSMDSTPTNVLFDAFTTGITCPIYLVRMWDSYIDDEFQLMSLYNEAKKTFPLHSFNTVSASLGFYMPT